MCTQFRKYASIARQKRFRGIQIRWIELFGHHCHHSHHQRPLGDALWSYFFFSHNFSCVFRFILLMFFFFILAWLHTSFRTRFHACEHFVYNYELDSLSYYWSANRQIFTRFILLHFLFEVCVFFSCFSPSSYFFFIYISISLQQDSIYKFRDFSMISSFAIYRIYILSKCPSIFSKICCILFWVYFFYFSSIFRWLKLAYVKIWKRWCKGVVLRFLDF